MDEPGPDLSAAFAARLNDFRAAHGVPPVTRHPILEAAAQDHAADMAARAVLTHGSGPENRETVANRIAARGYRWGFAAENVAFGQVNIQQCFDAWAGSDGHRANMLSDKAVEYGFGVMSNHIGPYWALALAAPL